MEHSKDRSEELNLSHNELLELEELSKSCPRCGKASANSSNPSGRCRSCLNKLAANKKKPGHWQRAQTKADDALRRQKGKNGTAHKKSRGLGTRESIVRQTQAAEKKTGQKLSPDRTDNSKGYAASNTRMVPEKLNRGRHHVDPKKLRAWKKRLKKNDIDTATLYTLMKAKYADNQETLELLKNLGSDGLDIYIETFDRDNEDVLQKSEQLELLSTLKQSLEELNKSQEDNDNVSFDSFDSFVESYVTQHNSELNKSEASLFRRYEDKYILPKTLKKSLTDLLSKHLQPDYPDKKTKFSAMKSIYFDSSNLDMIKHHLSKAQSRFKIRTREYAPNGELSKSEFTYLEVKAKQGPVTDKFRMKVPNSDIETFKKGLPITPSLKLIKANPHISVSDLVKRVQDINSAQQVFNIKPSCEITYNRRAYSDGQVDNGLRVTFDEDVRHNILSNISRLTSESLAKESGEDSLVGMLNGYDPDNHMILEVKHHGSVPDWLGKFLIERNIVKTNFSKYCYSMAKSAKGSK